MACLDRRATSRDGTRVAIYDRILPATAASIALIREEIDESLEWLDMSEARRRAVDEFVFEAAWVAALRGDSRRPAPLDVTAVLAAGRLVVTVCDCGTAAPRDCGAEDLVAAVWRTSACADGVTFSRDPAGGARRLSATFLDILPEMAMPGRGAASRAGEEASDVRDYARALEAARPDRELDSQAIRDEARAAVVRARAIRLQRGFTPA